MSEIEKILEKLEQTPGERFGVAFSGGKDSVVLASVMKKYYSEDQLFLLHVNHRVQDSVQSRAEVEFVDGFAKKYQLRLEREEIQDPVPKDEASLRKLRYQLLSRMAKKLNLDWVATGHHGDDQIETFLMRLLRGSDLRGLSAMPSIVNLEAQNYFRPMLQTRLSVLEEWRQNEKLEHFEDLSNKELHYFRNQIRHRLSPLLEEISNGSGNRILELCGRISDHNQFTEEMEEHVLGKVRWKKDEETSEAIVDRNDLKNAPIVLLRVWCRKSLTRWTDRENDITSKHIEAMAGFIRSESLGYYQELFPGNVQLRARKREIIAKVIP